MSDHLIAVAVIGDVTDNVGDVTDDIIIDDVIDIIGDVIDHHRDAIGLSLIHI